MGVHMHHSFTGGNLTKGPAHADAPSTYPSIPEARVVFHATVKPTDTFTTADFTLTGAQRLLYENVFSQDERAKIEELKGNTTTSVPMTNKQARQERKKQNRMAKEMGELSMGDEESEGEEGTSLPLRLKD